MKLMNSHQAVTSQLNWIGGDSAMMRYLSLDAEAGSERMWNKNDILPTWLKKVECK